MLIYSILKIEREKKQKRQFTLDL